MNIPRTTPFRAPGTSAGWLVLGLVLQMAVLWLDTRTPLGFAHGVLYAPAVVLGLVARRHTVIALLALVGVAGVALGMFISEERLSSTDDLYILLNRSLGVGAVLLVAVIGSTVLRLMRLRRQAFDDLEKTASLLDVSGAVGQLGGWWVELPARISHWSSQVSELLDYPDGAPSDVASVITRYAPEHRERVSEAFEACVVHGTPFDLEVQVLGRDGRRRWVRLVGRAVRDASGHISRVEGALQDVHAQKEAALELARSRAEWRQLAESLPMMVWVGEPDGLLSYMNSYGAEYVGATVDAMVGAGWLDFVHPDYHAPTLAVWEQARKDGGPYEVEFPVRRADGQWRWHFARAVQVALPEVGHRWYGTATDVQAIRDEQQARAELDSRLAETMESVTDAIFILDRDWRFRFLNRQAEHLLERRREELLGRELWEEFPAARGTIYQESYERCRSERTPVRFEGLYGPLGKLFEVNAYPSGEGLVVYFRDVGDARRMAEQVQQAQRMDALGQLTGGVAHDFNNLLTVILGNAEALAEAPGDASRQQMARMITDAARRGAAMTQRLLAFARRQALEPRPTDINRLVRQFAPLLERTLGEHVEMELVHAAGLWQAQVDPGQLEVALLNLAVNARDAMPQGGRLTIETANSRLDDAYAAGNPGVTAGQYVMLAVSDTGHGIPPDVLARVFEPFFTTKEVGKGTGLGLAMVYGFAKQSQGHVAIYSEVERGTTVRLYLPRVVGDAGRPERPLLAPSTVGGDGECVLLVEDDEMVRAYAHRQLDALGYSVLEAANGAEAMALLQAHPEVALLFTDVVMPGGMSGRQLADAARELRPGLPVLYTSGYTENAIVHHGRLDSGVLLLGKPYLRAELADKLRQALSRGA